MSNALPDFADRPDPVAKIGDLAAAAGVRRIHALAWRDLDDVEAGGSEVYVAEVAKRWAAAGLEVTLRTSWAQGQPTEAVRDGYRVIRRAGRHLVFPRAAAAEVLGRTGPRDVLVEVWNGMPFLSPLWNRGPRVVLVHHVHREMWHMTLGPTLGAAGALFEARVAPPFYRATPIVVPGESTRRELIDDLGLRADRVFVANPGLDTRYAPGGERSPAPMVVALGRVAPVKRYDMLVRAAHHARSRVPGLALHIVGDGYERPAIERVVDEMDARGWVTLHGYVTESEKVDLLRRAWIITSASAREGWGMTLTEAAACGTPAVATRIAGHADAVRDGTSGVLCGADPESLGDAMARVLSDDHLRDRLGRGALARARELTWDNTATTFTRVIADEVSRRRSRR